MPSNFKFVEFKPNSELLIGKENVLFNAEVVNEGDEPGYLIVAIVGIIGNRIVFKRAYRSEGIIKPNETVSINTKIKVSKDVKPETIKFIVGIGGISSLRFRPFLFRFTDKREWIAKIVSEETIPREMPKPKFELSKILIPTGISLVALVLPRFIK